MFYFFYKIIIFIVNNEKVDIRNAYWEFLTTRRQLNHIAHAIFVLHSAMKTHLLTNKNPRTIQIISYRIIKYKIQFFYQYKNSSSVFLGFHFNLEFLDTSPLLSLAVN